MSAEADAVCGAGYGERSAARSNRRNGYRHRDFDTRAGTLDVAIPKVRQGSYFPDWLPLSSSEPDRELNQQYASQRVRACVQFVVPFLRERVGKTAQQPK